MFASVCKASCCAATGSPVCCRNGPDARSRKERAAGLNGSSHSPRRRLWNWSRRSCTVCANEGGRVGTSKAQTVQERRDQFHSLRLGEWLDPFNPAARSFIDQVTAPFLQQTGDPAAAQQ